MGKHDYVIKDLKEKLEITQKLRVVVHKDCPICETLKNNTEQLKSAIRLLEENNGKA